MAEFWWGASPKAEVRHHGQYYPACRGKCLPILTWMLQGTDYDSELGVWGETTLRNIYLESRRKSPMSNIWKISIEELKQITIRYLLGLAVQPQKLLYMEDMFMTHQLELSLGWKFQEIQSGTFQP